MAEGMERHDEWLLGVRRDRGAACIDLAAALPKGTTIFYDDVHFNEPGSRRVATLVAEGLAADRDVRARLAP